MADSTGVSSEVSRDLSNLDVTKLTPLSPEVISKQATINIGTIGHVAHGKSTVVKALSGVQTVRFKNELERNITIKLEHQERGGNEDARVHSTVGPEEDEDLQVLAEIQSTMDSLNQKNWPSTENNIKEEPKTPLDSPSRPSVIQHTEIDSPAKRNISFEAASSVPRNSNSPDTMEPIPKPVIKRRPGPKSKTRPLEEMDAEKPVSEDSGNISDNSSTSTKKRLSDDVLNNSLSAEKHSTKNHDDSDSDDASTAIKKRSRDDSDSEQKLKSSKKRSSRIVSKDDSDSDHSTRVSKKRSSRLTSRDDSDSDHSSQVTKKRSTRKGRDGSEENSDNATSRPTRRQTRTKVNYDSDNSMDHFEVPKPRLTRSSRLPARESSTNSKKRKSTSYHDSSSDSETSTAASKRQRSSSKVETKGNDGSGSESDTKEKVEKKVTDKKKKKSKVDMTYRTKKTTKRRKKEPAVKVTRETPSETRVIEDNGPVDMTVGRQSDGDYEVEHVRGSKKIEGRQYYLIKWRGWPEHYNTWEPMEHLVHSQEALLEFFQTESIRSQERLAKLADDIPELTALTGKFAEYERDVVATLTREDFKDMDVTCPEGYGAILPNYKLLCSHINKYLKNNNEDLALKIKNLIIQREFVRQRHEQLQALETWEKDINNKIGEKVPLTVENNVDLEGPSDNFNFVLQNIPGEGVEIPDEPPIGCECVVCGDDSSCCGTLSGSKFAYTSEGLLQVEHGTPVYECNKMCKCGETCPNRVVQKGRTSKLHIFRTPNNIGWGVKVLEDIPQGKFICEYIGEVLKREVADERMKNEYKGRPLYIFDLDFNDAKEFPYTVDAYQHGNVSHFINHSCEPNLAVYAVWIDCLEPNLPRLAMFAIRDIKKGEELTFDYSAQYHRKRKSQANGYANAKIFKCNNEKCPRPVCYISGGSAKENSFPCQRPNCTGHYELLRHVSFVDCPGHDILMATMLSGAAVMDAALLLIAGNESCPQPQTKEHLAAVEIMKLNNIIILQNKIDLVKEGQAREQYQEVLRFVQGTVADGAPVIPISAQLKFNIEVLCEYITKKIPVPERDLTSPPRLIIIRSFDVNKPGCEAEDLKGGVAGGSILRGVLKVGMEVEVRPGIVSKDSRGETTCKPIFTRIVSLFAEQNELEFAVPGGLIGVGTKIDPTLCRADRLVGQVLGAVGNLPSIYIEIEITYFLLRRLLGVQTEGDKKAARVQRLEKKEALLLNIGSMSTGGLVLQAKNDVAVVRLNNPVCTELGEKVALSRRIDKHWRLIGWGQIRRGKMIEPLAPNK